MISDLGLTSFSGTEGLHVYWRSLGSAGPKPGVRVSLVSRSNRVLDTRETDEDGRAVFEAGLRAGPGCLPSPCCWPRTAMAFRPLTTPNSTSPTAGPRGEPAPPIDVFPTADRGAYRAGETVHATALARDGPADAIFGLPVTARLLRPDGV